MILGDRDIRAAIEDGSIIIDPFDAVKVQPASYDLTLSSSFKCFPVSNICDLGKTYDYEKYMVKVDASDSGIELGPGEFCLGVTQERVAVSDRVLGRIEGKSSLGRLGLLVHLTAGFVDPGWDGPLTLEFYNASPNSLILRPGQRIAQISFSYLHTPSESYYGLNNKGSYRESLPNEPMASRYKY